eukprot:gene1028-1578_t
MQVEGYHDAIRIAVADGSQKRGVELSASSTGTYTEADHQKEPEADGHLPDIISSHPLEPRQPHDALTGPGPYDANGSAIGYFQSQQSPAPAAAEQSKTMSDEEAETSKATEKWKKFAKTIKGYLVMVIVKKNRHNLERVGPGELLTGDN